MVMLFSTNEFASYFRADGGTPGSRLNFDLFTITWLQFLTSYILAKTSTLDNGTAYKLKVILAYTVPHFSRTVNWNNLL